MPSSRSGVAKTEAEGGALEGVGGAHVGVLALAAARASPAATAAGPFFAIASPASRAAARSASGSSKLRFTRPMRSPISVPIGSPVEHQLLRPGDADAAQQPARAAEARQQAEVHLGLAEAGAARGVDPVAGAGELAAAAEGEAVHRGDRRHRERLEGAERLVAEAG